MRHGVALLLAACLLLSGCSGLAGQSGETHRFERTVTPVPVSDSPPESGPGSLPPGITREGIGSLAVLTRGHRRALANRSYVWTEWEQTSTVRDDGPTVVVTRDERMHVLSPTVYTRTLERVRTSADATQTFQRATYADGTEWHRRTVNGTHETFTSGPVRSDRDRFAAAASAAIQQYLSVGNASVVRVSENGSVLYRVRTERPGRDDEYRSDYTAVAYVEPSGFVRRLSVSYVVHRDGVRSLVAYRFAYERRGNVHVRSPDWVGRAERAGEPG